MLDADEQYFKEHGEPLFSSHMIDLSAEDVEVGFPQPSKSCFLPCLESCLEIQQKFPDKDIR